MANLWKTLRTSLARNMMCCFFLVIIPTILLGRLSSQEGIRIASKEITSTYENAITLLSNQMADQMYNMDMLASAMLLDSDLIRISNDRHTAIDLFDYKLFREKMNLYRTPNFIDNEMTIFLPRQGWMLSIQAGVERADSILPTITQEVARKNNWLIRPSIFNPEEPCLSVYRGLVSDTQTRPFSLLEVSQDTLKNVLNTMVTDTYVKGMFFMDGLDGIICVGLDLDAALRQQILNCASGIYEKAQSVLAANGQRYQLIFHNVGNYSCRIGMLLDESELYMPLNRLQNMLIFFVIFGILDSLVFIVLTIRQIVTPITVLNDAMRELEKGNLNVRIDRKFSDVFSFMTQQFNTTIEQLNTMIREVYLSQLKLKNAQLRYLQSQINPHFLYNSLFMRG